MRFLYTLLFYSATPVILARLLWRGRKNPAYRQRIPERFGYYLDRASQEGVIWVHAVSVGEAESAVPLVRRLRESYPKVPVLVTTTTPTGSARVSATFNDGMIDHCYLPYDLPGSVSRFLTRFRPRLAVILETEIWPNLFAACDEASIPLCIVNARMSSRSWNGYRRVRSLVGSSLARVAGIAAQTEQDGRRFIMLGADPSKVTVTGNLKFDVEMPEGLIGQGRTEREMLFTNRPVLIAASTHEGEEQTILDAFGELQRKFPGILLVLVPRHPERFAAVAGVCRKLGHSVVLRSDKRGCAVDDDVFLLDSMGELKRFYAAADVALVGGSLVRVGGHNVLEPAAVGCPVLFGPYVENFREICSALVAAGGALEVDNVSLLTKRLTELFENSERRKIMGERAKSFLLANRGTLDRVIGLLAPYLPGAPAIREALGSSANGAGRPMKNP